MSQKRNKIRNERSIAIKMKGIAAKSQARNATDRKRAGYGSMQQRVAEAAQRRTIP